MSVCMRQWCKQVIRQDSRYHAGSSFLSNTRVGAMWRYASRKGQPVPVIGTSNFQHMRPNAVVDWLTFLLRIREIPGSTNLGPETGYPDRCFIFFSIPPSKCLDCRQPYIRPPRFPSTSFKIYHSLTTLSFEVGVTEKASLNKLLL
jgi:hypothetical protein